VFEQLCCHWNSYLVDISNKIFPKIPSHFIRYVKKWRKNQDRRDAEIASGSNRLSLAMEYVPASGDISTFEPMSLNNSAVITKATETSLPIRNIEPSSTRRGLTNLMPSDGAVIPPLTGALQALCVACSLRIPVQEPNQRQKLSKKQRQCRVTLNGAICPNPTECPGKSNRKNCILITGGLKEKKARRKKPSEYIRKCSVCGSITCKGGNMRSRCPQYNHKE